MKDNLETITKKKEEIEDKAKKNLIKKLRKSQLIKHKQKRKRKKISHQRNVQRKERERIRKRIREFHYPIFQQIKTRIKIRTRIRMLIKSNKISKNNHYLMKMIHSKIGIDKQIEIPNNNNCKIVQAPRRK